MRVLFVVLSLYSTVARLAADVFWDRDDEQVLQTDVCASQSLNISCQPPRVLVVLSAVYGRLGNSSCVLTDWGHLGCHSNVEDELRTTCSGKSRCHVENLQKKFASPEIRSASTCPLGLTLHLRLRYRCVNVVSPSQCRSAAVLPLRSAYLPPASVNTRSCRWQLPSHPGQHVRLSVLSFARPDSSSCRTFASVHDGGRVRELKSRACDGNVDNERVTTESDDVSVQLMPSREHFRFLLHYQVVGCKLPRIPHNARLDQLDLDSAVLTCNDSSRSWQLTCNDGSFWEGTMHDCAAAAAIDLNLGIGNLLSQPNIFSFGLAVFIIVAVAILICVFILFVGMMHMRRRKRRRERLAVDRLSTSNQDFSLLKPTHSYRFATIERYKCLHPCGQQRSPQSGAYTGMRLVTANPHTSSPPLHPRPVCSSFRPVVDHIYEQPDEVRRDHDSVENEQLCRRAADDVHQFSASSDDQRRSPARTSLDRRSQSESRRIGTCSPAEVRRANGIPFGSRKLPDPPRNPLYFELDPLDEQVPPV